MATMIGTFAALACWIASTVCGITPSSAATTSTTMSVILAPRARMAVNAAWPGVSMKVIVPPDGDGHLIGADMLGDAAGFAGRDIGRADGVEQRGLAVVDMAHDGDHRRARQQIRRVVRRVEQAFFHVGFRHAANGVAKFFGDQLRGVGVDRVVDLRHLALLHQQADHIDRALGHAVGEVLNGDRLRDGDFAHELFLRLVAVAVDALCAAAE